MTSEQFLDAIAADSARFATTSASALDTPIGHIEGWTARDLVAHLGAVYAGVTANASNPGPDPAAAGGAAVAPEGDAIVEWFAERRTAMLAALTEPEADTVACTFAGIKTTGWWRRRIAHETAVHRWDLDAAVHGNDDAAPIDSDLATDGVNEYIEVSLQHSSSRPNRIYPAESLHLHRSDGPGEWMLVGDGAGSLTVTEEHGKGDAAVRGSASSLVLWVWGRPAGGVEIFGDESVAQAWQDLAP